MSNIVIVEDRLGRGISLAEQFEKFSSEHPEYGIEVSAVCYFCSNKQKADEEIKEMEKKKKYEFDIKHVALSNFNKIMDEYLYCSKSQTFLIMDFILENDGSEGAPMRRVNIRYARNKNRLGTDQLWFYTGTGARNEEILRELVGEDHTFIVTKVDNEYLRLDLENKNFLRKIASNQIVEV